jgi:hypothetical protein
MTGRPCLALAQMTRHGLYRPSLQFLEVRHPMIAGIQQLRRVWPMENQTVPIRAQYLQRFSLGVCQESSLILVEESVPPALPVRRWAAQQDARQFLIAEVLHGLELRSASLQKD